MNSLRLSTLTKPCFYPEYAGGRLVTDSGINAQRQAIKGVWRILDPARLVHEIRAIPPTGTGFNGPPINCIFRDCDYHDLESRKVDFETTALKLNDQGYNVYTPFNGIRDDFIGPKGTKDVDITSRLRLLVDIDRRSNTSRPANQVEIEAARELAIKIRAYLRDLGWPEPVVMFSGNGWHLYFPLANLDNSVATTEKIRRTLLALSRTFDNETVGVDCVVYNAARITKIPGTIARKGVASEDRPYRMAMIIDDL